MSNIKIDFLNDMHLESQSDFMNYYNAMQSNNITGAQNILNSNSSLANQIINDNTINPLINGVNTLELTPKEDIDYFLEDLLNDFQEMIDNTKIMGEYNANTQYYPHNFVYYNGKGYYANSQPPIGTLPTNTNYWIEYDIQGFQGYGGIDLNLMFNWDNSTAYNEGDVVVYKNKLWCAVASNTGVEPNLNHYPWIIITMPQMPNKASISISQPIDYNIGEFWFRIIEGEDIITTTWGIRQPEPTPRFGAGSFVVGTNVYVVGGILSTFDRTNVNEMFDTLTSTWSEKAAMPENRARPAAFAIGDSGYCVGGIGDNGEILNTVVAYDSTTNTWQSKNNFPIPIVSSGTSYNSVGYIIGGETTDSVPIKSCYSYSAANDSWTQIADKSIETYGNAVVADAGYIYSLGGLDVNDNTVDTVEAFDISTGTWGTKANLAISRAFLGAFIKSGYIYAVGGLNNDWYSLKSNERYDIENNVWETDMPMNYARSSLSTAIVGTNAYAIGGINIGTSMVGGYVEQYDAVDAASDFEMTIDTTLGTNTVSIPMVSAGQYNYYIDWGDGTTSPRITTYNDTNATHTYTTAGEYVIKITGVCSILQFTGNIATVLKEVTKCILNFSTIENMFTNCTNLTNIVDTIFSSSPSVASINSTFEGCSSLAVIPVDLFSNNINIVSAQSTFEGCSSLTNIPTGLFNNQSQITNFSNCFNGCSSLTSIPTNLFASNLSANNFSSIFASCSGLTNIPAQLFASVSYATNMSSLFENCTGISSIPEGLFSTNSAVTTFNSAFKGCTSLTTLPSNLFANCLSVTDYSETFASTNVTVIPNNCFNGNNATCTNIFDDNKIVTVGDNSLYGLNLGEGFFQDNTVLTTVGNDVFGTNTTSLRLMFNGCTNLTTIGNIDMSTITNLSSANLFGNCTALTTVAGFKDRATHTDPTLSQDLHLDSSSLLTHDSLINISDSLVTMTPTTMKTLYLHPTALNRLSDGEKLAIVNKNWNLDGYTPDITSESANDLVSELYPDYETTSTATEESTQYFIVDRTKDREDYKFFVDKNTGIVYEQGQEPIKEYCVKYTLTNNTTTQTLYISKTATNDIDGDLLKTALNNLNTDRMLLKTVEFVPIYEAAGTTSNLLTAVSLFDSMESLTTIKGLDTSNCTSLESTFSWCSSLTYVNDLNTSKVTNMANLFSNCILMTNYPVLSDTSKVTNMNNIFASNSQMTSAPELNVSAVTTATWMFDECVKLTTVPTYNFSNLIDGSRMFNGCTALTNMPANVTLSKVEDINGMFAECTGLTTVRANYFPNTVKSANALFDGCTKLTTLPSNVTQVFGNNSNLTDVSYLFSGCTALKTIGTHTVATYDMGTGNVTFNQTALNNQIFRYCPNITDMSYICSGCTSLGNNTDFPQALFYWCPNVTTVEGAFQNCTALVNPVSPALNKTLFVNNTELVNISYLFDGAGNTSFNIFENYGYSSGGVVYEEPNLMFPNSTKIEDASYCFRGINFANISMTVPFPWNSPVLKNIEGIYSEITRSWLFDLDGHNETYGFANLNKRCPVLENCSRAFYGDSALNTEGMPFVTAAQKISTLTNYQSCFTGCTSLRDFNEIPAAWKANG